MLWKSRFVYVYLHCSGVVRLNFAHKYKIFVMSELYSAKMQFVHILSFASCER